MLFENIREAFHNLSSNRLRSLLTMLGIIIGISAVITITTIGSSIRSTLNATLNSLAGNRIEVYTQAIYPDDINWDTFVYPEMDKDDYITQEMLDELKETYPEDIKGFLMEQLLGSGQVYENSKHYANIDVYGISPETFESKELDLLMGRNVTAEDNTKQKNVVVVSDKFVSNYFDDENPLGQSIQFNTNEGASYQFTIIGVYEYKDSIFGKPDTTIPERDRLTTAFIPINTMMGYSTNEQNGFTYADILISNTSDSTEAETKIKEFFDEKYADNPDWQILTYNLSSQIGTIDTIINIITVAISFIAAISLIVGGVGVMNIMLVSITERTREIGIRKALGAKNKTIRQQFLIEAIVLCLIGGIIGILIGLVLGLVLGKVTMFVVTNYYSDYADLIIMNIKPSVSAIILSVVFSMITGVFFGYYPAKKASNMEVIDALGYE